MNWKSLGNPPDGSDEILRPEGWYYWQLGTRAWFEREYERVSADFWKYITTFRSREQRISEKPRYTELLKRCIELRNIMAKGTTRREPIDEAKGTWKAFVERPLTPDEIADALDRKLTPKDAIERLCGLVVNGYKVALSTGKDGQVCVSLTDYRKDSKTSGYTLSTWADDPGTALVLALYKHFNVLNQEWSPLIGQGKGKRIG